MRNKKDLKIYVFYKQDPPLTSINCPVTQRLSGEARNAAVSAMSSTSPKRLKAEIVVAYCFIIGSLKSSAFISVLINPGTSGHLEVVQITFDPSIFPYQKLLDLYWPQIDPTDDGGQFFDRGPSYRTAIFYHNETQKGLAEKSKQALTESGMFKDPIVTEIRPAAPFYAAEEYHQHFYKKNPEKYATEQKESGREDFIKENWQKK